jgi:hypothetical protein
MFYNQIVLKLKDYTIIRDSCELGHNKFLLCAVDIATSLFHFREHFPDQERKSRALVESECQSYGILADISNASKHSKISSETPHGKPLIASADSIKEVLVFTGHLDDLGPYWDAHCVVSVNLEDGTSVDIEDILIEVANYWAAMLNSLHLCNFSSFDELRRDKSRQTSRSDARVPKNSIAQGLRFSQIMQILIYDSSKEQGVPLHEAENGNKFLTPAYLLVGTTQDDHNQNICLFEIELSEVASGKLEEVFGEKDFERVAHNIVLEMNSEIQIKCNDALDKLELIKAVSISFQRKMVLQFSAGIVSVESTSFLKKYEQSE